MYAPFVADKVAEKGHNCDRDSEWLKPQWWSPSNDEFWRNTSDYNSHDYGRVAIPADYVWKAIDRGKLRSILDIDCERLRDVVPWCMRVIDNGK